MDKKVTAEMNSELTKTFTKEKVEMTLIQMAPLKSPSPDGFNPCFYQTYWHIVSENVTLVVLNLLIRVFLTVVSIFLTLPYSKN